MTAFEPAGEPGDPSDPAAGVTDEPRHSYKAAIEWGAVVVGAIIIAIVIKTFLFQAFYIPSPSMEPTLEVGDRVLVNKLSYRAHDIHRGDIVVFRRPDNAPADGQQIDDLIKRVVALPGERVSASGGHVFINGEELDEPYLPQGTTTPDFFPDSGCVPSCVVPDGEIFVLGDNRDDSEASNRFGPIDDDLVVGRAFIRVWPLSRFGGI